MENSSQNQIDCFKNRRFASLIVTDNDIDPIIKSGCKLSFKALVVFDINFFLVRTTAPFYAILIATTLVQGVEH